MSSSDNSDLAATDDHWEIYVTYVDDKPAVIMVDLGVSQVAPIGKLSKLAWAWVFVQAPDEEGFPTDDEDIRLNEIEDAITDSLAETSAKYVGRITSDGRREFYFYTDNPDEFQLIATTAMQAGPEYRYEVDHADDEEWRHYFDVLQPSPEGLQQIHNNHVINQLQQAGDSLTVPRPVDHFANFKSEEDRTSFIQAAAESGFEATSQPNRDPAEEFPFAVGLLRIDAVDPDTIDEITFELFDLAQQHNGEYEGWGSKVVKS